MTTAVAAAGGINPLANVLKQHTDAIAGLQSQGMTYVIDPKTGNCVYMFGPDISMAPINAFSKTPSMASTGLTGPGAASKKTGSWVQL
jgi:hypothetical protein